MSINMTGRPNATRGVLLGVGLAALLTLYSCTTLRGGPVGGHAVDADTGKPLTNAVAYGIWDGLLTTPLRTDANCVWAESVRLDEQGKFNLPAWRKHDPEGIFTSHVQQTIFVYAPGYDLRPLTASDLPEVKLKRFTGSVEDRFKQLNISPCVPDDSLHNVAIVYRMMAEEMDQLEVADPRYRGRAELVHERAKGARTDRTKPTVRNEYGYLINRDPNDQFPE